MKNKWMTKLFALVICVALLVSGLPITAFAEEATDALSLIEGDVIADFAPAGTDCTSTDESIAWVDEAGALNALKPGTTTICVPSEDGTTEYTVTVEDYDDGSDIVGNLKILARYNDSMQFYDGHVYLLFTSYQDGITITVPDLYAGYEISDEYYADIREDIANGSNHSGTDTDSYFTLNDEMTSVTLNRGEIVTIGMYRDFDMTVPQAALGSIKNSSLWNELKNAGKTAVVETVFRFLENGQLNTDEAIAKLKAVFEEEGLDYNKLLDGVVDGGLCFNRELYNQKLEWDQYENVTYEMDITRNQLNMMTMYLGGNLNKFSILKNSCATVALRAWNAAVGTRNGVDTAYKLSSTGEGIFALIDAPKSVRDSIVSRLPGYYLNNAEGVAEPDAGFEDETGCVYVSAPEKVAPITFVYADNAIQIDEDKTDIAKLMAAAGSGQAFSYNKDEQQVEVNISASEAGDATSIDAIDFTANEKTVTINADNVPEEGIWFTAEVAEPADGEDYYVTDADGKALPSEYADGCISFHADTLPVSYQIVGSSEGTKNLLKTVIVNGDKVKAETEIYYKDGDKKVVLDSIAEVNSGTEFFVKSTLDEEEYDYLVSDITFNGESIFNEDNFDAEEGAYTATMPASYSKLTVDYEMAVMESVFTGNIFQIAVGETANVSDYAELYIGDDEIPDDHIVWKSVFDSEDAVTLDGDTLTAVKAGSATVWACAEGNENIGLILRFEVYENDDEMAVIFLDDAASEYASITAAYDDETIDIPFDGYMVKKGSVLTIEADPADGKAITYVIAGETMLKPGETYTVTDDTEISVGIADATVKGMPKEIKLAAKGDTYQLNAQVQYSGLSRLLPVYDASIRYESSDELVTVDETGLITVTGDVPEDGKAVMIIAIPGSCGAGVCAVTKVIVGDYKGSRIVGKVTVSARPITKEELVAHGALTFTTYEDLDLETSFYEYYKPNDKYNDLMIDYEQNPENYTSDPALYNNNDLGLENRESYFDVYKNGPSSDPQTISLKAGESITLSNYGFDSTNLLTIRLALESETLSSSKETQELIKQMKLFAEDDAAFDAPIAFDSLLATLQQLYVITGITGRSPADGHSEGGICVNRELYNQFRRNDSQMPNNYYSIEITADELELLKNYLADPGNNYYSLLAKNCATGVVDIWNTVLVDKPELRLTANYTGFAADPQSLNIELGLLRIKQAICDYEGKAGTDFYPRTVAYSDAVKNVIDMIAAIGEVELSEECAAAIEAAFEAYDALNELEQERVWNIKDLYNADVDYIILKAEADMNEYTEYQQEQLAAADELLQDDDGIEGALLVAVAKMLIQAREYDDELTVEENKAGIDSIMDHLVKDLEAMRARKDEPDEPIILGDVDGDGKVTIYDASAIQRYLAGMEPDPFNEAAADADGDGKVTIYDASAIQRYLAGMDAPEGIGNPI